MTQDELLEQMGISEKTMHKLISEGDLPEPTYGGPWSRKRGWHKVVLEQAAIDKYQNSKAG